MAAAPPTLSMDLLGLDNTPASQPSVMSLFDATAAPAAAPMNNTAAAPTNGAIFDVFDPTPAPGDVTSLTPGAEESFKK